MKVSKTTPRRNPRRSTRKVDQRALPSNVPSENHSTMAPQFGEAEAELLMKQQAYLVSHLKSPNHKLQR
jgi:hypothetical protein